MSKAIHNPYRFSLVKKRPALKILPEGTLEVKSRLKKSQKISVLRSRVREQNFAAHEIFVLLTSFSLKFCANTAYYILNCSRVAHEY